jgi:hypothetical protein
MAAEAESTLHVVVEALASELRAAENSLAHWRAHACRLHTQVRAMRRAPDHELGSGAPRSMLPLADAGRTPSYAASSRSRECSISSINSFASTSTFRARAPAEAPWAPQAAAGLSNVFTREFWDPQAAEMAQRRVECAVRLQAQWRGARQRQRYAAASAFFAIVNGAIELRSGWQTVPAYTITVVRGGHCWQVSHRFSDWIELDRQIAKRLHPSVVRPALPSRMPWSSQRIVNFRQFALNRYLQRLFAIAHPVSAARRTLLNFLSRSHLHWLYAGSAVLLAAPTAARLSRQDERLSTGDLALADGGSVFGSVSSGTHQRVGGGGMWQQQPPYGSPWNSNALPGVMEEVRDASTGRCGTSAILEERASRNTLTDAVDRISRS